MPKGRKPKLTEEEKKRLKEEKIEALKEGLRQIKRDRLTREIKYGVLTRKKLQKKWIKMLIEKNLQIHKTDLEYTANMCDFILDNKDFQISLLLDELDIAEELYNINFRSYVTNIHKILESYQFRLNTLKDSYDEEYNNLICNNKFEIEDLNLIYQNAHDYIKVIIFELNEERKLTETELHTYYLSKIKEDINQSNNFLTHKSQQIERKFEEIWNKYQKTIKNYLHNIKEINKQCEILHKQDNFITLIIKEQYNLLYDLHQKLYISKQQQIKLKEQTELRITLKKQERDLLQNIYEKLRRQYIEHCKTDNKKITKLVVFSNNTLKEMNRIENVCNSVVKMYAICEKFETQNEKILRFPQSEPKYKHISMRKPIINKNEIPLDNFMMKCGQADTIRHVLYEERAVLKKCNTSLKSLLRFCTNKCN